MKVYGDCLRSAFLLIQMGLRSGLATFRHFRARLFLGFLLVGALIYNIVLALWLGSLLAIGKFADLPWLLVLVCWFITGGFALLITWQHWLNPERVLYLFLLPLRPAVLFRSLFLTTCIGHVGVRALLLLSGILFVLLWQNPLCLLLVVSGLCLAVCCGMIIGWLGLLWMTATPGARWGSALGLVTLVGLALWLLLLNISFVQYLLRYPISPLLLSGGLLLLTALVWFLAAPLLGKLFIRSYQQTQSMSRGRTRYRLPSIERITRLLFGKNPMLSALFFKGLLTQSRNALNGLRLVLFLASLPGFLLLARLPLVDAHFTLTFSAIAYGTFLGLYFFLDAMPSPLGSEGNRLTLYLTTPYPSATILRAKLILYALFVSLGIGLLGICACLGLRLGLVTTLLVQGMVLLINSGVILLMVLGSIWDEDLSLTIEGNIQAILYEQLPSTPRRLLLLLASIFLAGSSLLLVWYLPEPAAACILFVCDLLLGTLLLRWSRSYLISLIKHS